MARAIDLWKEPTRRPSQDISCSFLHCPVGPTPHCRKPLMRHWMRGFSRSKIEPEIEMRRAVTVAVRIANEAEAAITSLQSRNKVIVSHKTWQQPSERIALPGQSCHARQR